MQRSPGWERKKEGEEGSRCGVVGGGGLRVGSCLRRSKMGGGGVFIARGHSPLPPGSPPSQSSPIKGEEVIGKFEGVIQRSGCGGTWGVGLEPGAASFVAAGNVEGGAGYPAGGGADEVENGLADVAGFSDSEGVGFDLGGALFRGPAEVP